MVRHLTLFAAAAAEVQAIDGVYAEFSRSDGARREAETVCRDGFTGKLAIHPSQVEIFNDAFTPSQQAIDEAQKDCRGIFKSGCCRRGQFQRRHARPSASGASTEAAGSCENGETLGFQLASRLSFKAVGSFRNRSRTIAGTAIRALIMKKLVQP